MAASTGVQQSIVAPTTSFGRSETGNFLGAPALIGSAERGASRCTGPDLNSVMVSRRVCVLGDF
jgi:hypothetical protein